MRFTDLLAPPTEKRELPENPWEIIRDRGYGDILVEDLYEAVGFALCTWELVEVEVLILAALAAKISPRELSEGDRFRKAGNVQKRMDVIEGHLVGFYSSLKGAVLKHRIEVVCQHIRGAANRRNDIAHGTVMTQTSFEGTSAWLTPPRSQARKWNEDGPIYAYTSQEIREYGRRFEALRQELHRLIDLL